jgi:RNA polymerase sigma-70 factor, ECF subfamily
MTESNLHPEGAMGAAPSEGSRLDPAIVQGAYEQHAAEIHNFLRGVLRDSNSAQDCLQATFVKAIESGHTVEGSLKAWLFRVAFNTAMEFRRREQTGERITDRLAEQAARADDLAEGDSPLQIAAQAEEIEHLKQAFKNLPTEQQIVARMRVFEQKKFATIARELNLPLGTVLTRMRSAVEKLRRALTDDDQQSIGN